MVSNQDKPLGIKQWSYTNRLADLRGFIYNAEIKPAMGKNGMLDAHTGGCHYKLERGKRNPLLLHTLNTDRTFFTFFWFRLHASSPPCCKAAPAVTVSELPSSEHFPPCTTECRDEPVGTKTRHLQAHRILETLKANTLINLRIQNLQNSETVHASSCFDCSVLYKRS